MKQARRIAVAGAVLFSLYAIGTCGYFLIAGGSATPLDALYMTVTTLGSVGFGEITPGASSPAGRVFTIGLILSGMVTLVFVTTSLTAFFVEGDMSRLLEKRKMDKLIAKLKDHYIVCGSGSTGVHIIAELVATQRPVIFIENNPERITHALSQIPRSSEVPYLLGDATDDLLLRRAGIDKAKGLAAALANDKDNLFITIAARQMNANLRIIARATEQSSMEKLRRAGAQSVISPNMIGGMRMVSEMVRPSVVSFLDLMLRDKDKNMRIEEVTIGPTTALFGRSLGETHLRDEFEVSVLAVKESAEAPFVYNPPSKTPLSQGMVLVVLGHADGVAKLRVAAEV